MTASVFGMAANPSAIAEIQSEAAALREGLSSVKDALKDLQVSMDQGLRGSSMSFGNVGQVRSTIEKFAKTSGKFPEFLDIGLGVFYDIYDWHVRHNQQIQVSRVSDNRIMIIFMFTQLIMRWENDSNYIGVPY
jgi:hypothetical protein